MPSYGRGGGQWQAASTAIDRAWRGVPYCPEPRVKGTDVKSFSSSSFANNHEEALARAAEAVKSDPLALFTNFQWFLYAGKDTIFFTAFSRHVFDKEMLKGLVRQMVELAPQLTHGFLGARPGQPLTEAQLDAIASVVEVASFEGYPDSWLSESADVFEHKDLPLFRVMAANLAGGPDAEGRACVVQVRAAHCLLEGSDSALMMRSELAAHGIMSDKSRKVAVGQRVKGAWGGFLIAGLHMLGAYALAPRERRTYFKTLALRRDRMRALATKFGVRQRSLYFAVVTQALFGEPERRHKQDAIVTRYTMLDNHRNAGDDDFFRVRALDARFPVADDFATYVRGVDAVMEQIEKQDTSRFQGAVNSMFAMHRAIHAVAPWLYGPRFWRFSGTSDIVLTLVPPHHAMGPLTEWLVEPIYVGAFHPSSNICTFCPGREYMTISFALGKGGIDRVDEIMKVVERAEAMAVPALPARSPEAAGDD